MTWTGPPGSPMPILARIEIGLAGPFAHGLFAGGFIPGKEPGETYLRAIDAHLRGSEDAAVQYALAGEVTHLNVSVGEDIVDKVIWAPYLRTILFDISDHWHLVELVASVLIERDSLSQAQLQIIQAREAQRGPRAGRTGGARVQRVAARTGLAVGNYAGHLPTSGLSTRSPFWLRSRLPIDISAGTLCDRLAFY
jgi:hypothetical protein